jgi:ATP-dependent DNA helicase RecQ
LPPDPVTNLAKVRFGIDYLFPYQRLVISNIFRSAGVDGFAPTPYRNPVTGETETVDTTPHQIVILPTGAGKSLCFMLPAAVLPGPTLVVFPLLSLMADQERRVLEAGMGAAVLKGGQPKQERAELWRRIDSGEVQMVLTNPETALQPATLKRIGEAGFSHLVIDETHTVSEWGQTFRPVYLEIGELARQADIPLITAFTATASEMIIDKVKEIIFPGLSPNVMAANPDRPNIAYRVIPTICKEHDLAVLLGGTDAAVRAGGSRDADGGGLRRPALVFCRSRVSAEMTARYLRRRLGEREIFFYHAGMTKEEKKRIEEWFFHSKNGILCSTCAYGMGVDKKDIRTVIHRDLSPSIESYLQESGRAGRNREQAEAVLLYSPEDRKLADSMTGEIERARYTALLRFAEDGGTCRRESLLALLGARPEACFGCDVCRGSVQDTARGEAEILRFLNANRRRYAFDETAQILAGDMTYDVQVRGLWMNPRFGALAGWSREEAESALAALEREGRIKNARRIFWGRTLTAKRPRRYKKPAA